MRIYARQTLNGIPLLLLRDVCLVVHSHQPNAATELAVATALDFPEDSTALCLGILRQHDYVLRIHGTPVRWKTTLKGATLAKASAERKMTRKHATMLLHETIARIQTINRSQTYPFAIARLDVFGSYAKGAKFCSDLDLRIEVVMKPGVCTPARLDRIRNEAPDHIRALPHLLKRWPWIDLMQTVAHDNPRINIHLPDDGIFDKPDCVRYEVWPTPDPALVALKPTTNR